MSASFRARAHAPAGVPRPPHRWRGLLALPASTAAALGLAVAFGPAANAAQAPLATYYVAPNGTDTDGSCTANTASNAFPAIADGFACAVNGDAISLAATGTSPYQGFGTVSHNITISAGPGANARKVTVDATASANLTVAAGAKVTLTGVTIDGSSDASTPDVTNAGTLTLTRDAITGNLINGGILNDGTGASLTLNASTVSGNNGGSGGGGITTTGTGTKLTVNNSTIADNITGSAAGGVAIASGTAATFVNSTITGNQGQSVIGGLLVEPGGSAALSNTIVAGNTGLQLPDCGGVLSDGPGGHNLIGTLGTGSADNSCSGLTNGVDGDQVGASAGLLPLANYGGPTDTAALVAGSPAVGAGNTATCENAPINGKDQRGDSRNAATRGCDIGAYDTGGKTVRLHTYYVAPHGTDTTGSCTANTAGNAFPTIADGLACAVNGDAISLAPTAATPYPGFGTVSHSITIAARSGAGARTVAVDESSAALTVATGTDVVLTGVTLNGGSNPTAPDVTNNGYLTLARDTITGNQTSGGILNQATGASNAGLTLNGTTVSGNVAVTGGGGITSAAGTGAGTESVTAENSTIAGNSGLGVANGVDLSPGTTAAFVNATITGNDGSGTVGGLQVSLGATAALSNTVIAQNTGGSFADCLGVLSDGPGGHNLIGDTGTSCTGLTNGVNGDLLNVAAGLQALANNGGPTDTAALAAGSPAIGAADATACERFPISDKDQRGDSRNAPTRGCDIGAYDTGGAG